MTPATERTLKTWPTRGSPAHWLARFSAGCSYPAALSVEYLTPIVVTGPFAGLIAAAGVLANRRRAAETDRATA